MSAVQQFVEWVCLAGLAAVGAFALLRLVWRHRLDNAAIAAPFATLEFPAGATTATNTVSIPAFPSSPHSAFFALSDGADSDGDGGWSACDLAVELRLDGPEYMDFDTVHPGDGVRVNIGTNDVDTVTLALRATGPSPRLDRPLYLLRWTAGIVLDASNTAARASALLDGGVKRAFAARRAESGRFELPFTFDFSTLPAHGISGSSFPSDHDMDFQLRLPPNPSLRVEHLESVGGLPDIFGPMLFVADEPSTAQLPPEVASTNALGDVVATAYDPRGDMFVAYW